MKRRSTAAAAKEEDPLAELPKPPPNTAMADAIANANKPSEKPKPKVFDKVTPIHRGQAFVQPDPDDAEVAETQREVSKLLQGMKENLEYEQAELSLGDSSATKDDSVALGLALAHGNPVLRVRVMERKKQDPELDQVMIGGKAYPAPRRTRKVEVGKDDKGNVVFDHVPDKLTMTELVVERFCTIKHDEYVFGGTETTDDEKLKQAFLKETILGRLSGEFVEEDFSARLRPDGSQLFEKEGQLTGKYFDWAGHGRHVTRLVTRRLYQSPSEPLPMKAFVGKDEKLVKSRTRVVEGVAGYYGTTNIFEDKEELIRASAYPKKVRDLRRQRKPNRQCSWWGHPHSKKARDYAEKLARKRTERSEELREQAGKSKVPPRSKSAIHPEQLGPPKWWWFLNHPDNTGFVREQVYPRGLQTDVDADQANAEMHEGAIEAMHRVAEAQNNVIAMSKGYMEIAEADEAVAVSLEEEDDGLTAEEIEEVFDQNSSGSVRQPTERVEGIQHIPQESDGIRTLAGWDFESWKYQRYWEYVGQSEEGRYAQWWMSRLPNAPRKSDEVERSPSVSEAEQPKMKAEARPLKQDGKNLQDSAEPSEVTLVDRDGNAFRPGVTNIPAALNIAGALELPGNYTGALSFLRGGAPSLVEISTPRGSLKVDLATPGGLHEVLKLRQSLEEALDRQLTWVDLLKRLEKRALSIQGVPLSEDEYTLEVERIPNIPTQGKLARFCKVMGLEMIRPEVGPIPGFAKVQHIHRRIQHCKKVSETAPRGRLRLKKLTEEYEAKQNQIAELQEEMKHMTRTVKGLSRRQRLDRIRWLSDKVYRDHNRWLRITKQRREFAQNKEALKQERLERGVKYRVRNLMCGGFELRDQRAQRKREALEKHFLQREVFELKMKRLKHKAAMHNPFYRVAYNTLTGVTNLFSPKSKPEQSASIPPTVGEVESDMPRQPTTKNTGPQRVNTAEDARKIGQRMREKQAVEAANQIAREIIDEAKKVEASQTPQELSMLGRTFVETQTGIVVPKLYSYSPPAGTRLQEYFERIKQRVG